MRLHRLPILLCALRLSTITASAQQYQPSNDNPNGPELIGVYISSTWCIGNRAPGLHQAIDSLKLILQHRAQQSRRRFRMIGVALDWATDSGLAYLKEFGGFDEIAVGRNWFNLAAERFIWSDSTAQASIPQVLVYEQTTTTGARRARRPTIGPPHVIKRVYGGAPIVEWVQRGAPIP